MKATYETGVQGEEMACRFLTGKGMKCLETRYREKIGEIDLIMEDGETLVFVEVKARFSGEKGQGLQAVTPAKQRKIARCATLYLMKQGWLRRDIRFDVVEINQEGIIHIPNAFQPGGMMF
ncbi:MAG: YraN family protein [Clostridiales bacterium]|nr:YraN family protein [Clostridiales bacterium]